MIMKDIRLGNDKEEYGIVKLNNNKSVFKKNKHTVGVVSWIS